MPRLILSASLSTSERSSISTERTPFQYKSTLSDNIGATPRAKKIRKSLGRMPTLIQRENVTPCVQMSVELRPRRQPKDLEQPNGTRNSPERTIYSFAHLLIDSFLK